MNYVRIYADEQGESHFQDVEVPLSPSGAASWLSEMTAVKGVIFRRNTADQFVDWHHAPRRSLWSRSRARPR